jgi:hypothetical protein
MECWTSSLRSRSGLLGYTGSPAAAPFTMRGHDLSNAMFKLLHQSSYRHAAPFSRKRLSNDTVYHCEVFMTAGDSNDWFSLNPTRFQEVSSNHHTTFSLEQVFRLTGSAIHVAAMRLSRLLRIVCCLLLYLRPGSCCLESQQLNCHPRHKMHPISLLMRMTE